MASSSRAKLLNPTQYHLEQQQQQQHNTLSHPLSLYDQELPSSSSPFVDQDNFSQTFLSPNATTLDELDDVDYQSGMYADSTWLGATSPPAPQHHNQRVQPMPMMNNHHNQYPLASFGGSPPSSSGFTGPMSAPANILSGFPIQPTPSSFTNQQHQHQPEMAKSLEEDYAMQMNLQMVMEKRRRRRESHNQVERRRRDNINDRIQELGTLLPETMLDTSGTFKPNKGMILKKSVDHIKFLQQEVTTYRQRIQELENVLSSYQAAKRQ
ncbi:HLH-domain-containing protein [Lichtheimia hyalospora FSU 10163]|nr:HLH-domain-containing protein [Lichtheimia hyalospora FSU 10163]